MIKNETERKVNKRDNIKLKEFRIVLAAGCVLVSLSLLLSLSNEEKYVEVFAGSSSADQSEAYAEPFGYFMGEWNLWEFIGDSASSLFRIP